MKKQLTLSASDFERLRKPTRREKILAEMSAVVPCKKLAAVIEPHYPKRTSVGCRPPVERDRVLRIHCLQLWFNLSDPALEEALYDSLAMRSFVGIDLGRGPVPDEATVMRFRYLLKKQKLGERIFEQVGRLLVQRGLRLSKSTIVDATIIAATSRRRAPTAGVTPRCIRSRSEISWHSGESSEGQTLHEPAVRVEGGAVSSKWRGFPTRFPTADGLLPRSCIGREKCGPAPPSRTAGCRSWPGRESEPSGARTPG